MSTNFFLQISVHDERKAHHMFVSGCNNEMVEKLILIKSQQSQTTESTEWQSSGEGGSDRMKIVHESILLNETAKSSTQ